MAKKENKSILEIDISIKGVNLTQKLVFARYLSVMLKSGLTIAESLDIIYDQANGRFKKVVYNLLKSVEAGNSLSDALSKYPKIFSSLFINTVYAGENSGTLEKNLDNIAEQLKGEKELSGKIKSAMVYPIIVLVATFILGMAMAFLVLPKITPLFKGLGMDLPITTRILIFVSETIQNHGLLLFLGIVFTIVFVTWFLRLKAVRPITHMVLLKTPVISRISTNTNIARFCRTLGTLLKSGLNIDEALDITKNTLSNYYFQKSVADVSHRIGQGTKLSDNLQRHEKYFPKLTTSMVRVGERSGRLEESLFYLAEFYEAEVDLATKALSTAIEPILLIGIGLVVGGMALSIITPIYQMTGSVSK